MEWWVGAIQLDFEMFYCHSELNRCCSELTMSMMLTKNISPIPHCDITWSSEIYQAYELLFKNYQSACTCLTWEDGDKFQLQFHTSHIKITCFNILGALETEGLPMQWLLLTSKHFQDLLAALNNAITCTENE